MESDWLEILSKHRYSEEIECALVLHPSQHAWIYPRNHPDQQLTIPLGLCRLLWLNVFLRALGPVPGQIKTADETINVTRWYPQGMQQLVSTLKFPTRHSISEGWDQLKSEVPQFGQVFISWGRGSSGYHIPPNTWVGALKEFRTQNSRSAACSCITDSLSYTMCVETNEWNNACTLFVLVT